MAGQDAPIEFDVGGVVYGFSFTTNALCSLEGEFGGRSIASVGEMISTGSAGVSGARALFRAGLTEDRPAITPVETGRLMGELGADRASELVQEAFDRLKNRLSETIGKLPAPDARGRLSFEVAGIRLTLAFGMNAQAEMELYFGGLTPAEIRAKLQADGCGLQDMRAMFRAALVDDRDLSLVDAGRLMDRIGIRVAGEAIKAAYPAAFPKPPLDGEGDAATGNRQQRRAAAAKKSPTKRPAKGGTG